jgi:hypothetical protein
MIRSIVFAAVLAALPAFADAQEDQIEIAPPPSQVLNMTMGISTTIRTARPFKQVSIVDQAVVDAVAETNKVVNLVPKGPGVTNVTIYDENNVRIATLAVTVERTPEKAADLARQNFAHVPGRIVIHNHPQQLAGASIYSCAPGSGCDLVKEVLSELPLQTQQPPYQPDNSGTTSPGPSTGDVTTTYRGPPVR